MNDKKTNRILIRIFPGLFVIVSSIFSFSEIFNFDLSNLFTIFLVFIFPTLFLLQGIFCFTEKVEPISSLFISSISFIFVIIYYLDIFEIIYLFVFIAFFLTGYYFAKSLMKSAINKLNFV